MPPLNNNSVTVNKIKFDKLISLKSEFHKEIKYLVQITTQTTNYTEKIAKKGKKNY